LSKKKARAQPAVEAGRTGARRFGRRSLFAVAVIMAAAAAVAGRALYDRAGRNLKLPPPPPSDMTAPAETTVAYGDFVGSEACASCHPSEYRSWSSSTHGKAGGPPTPERVKGPFDGRPIHFRDATVTPSRSQSGGFIFTVVQEQRPAVVYRVEAVVGGGFMAGGGTQAAFGRFPDGTLRFLPFDYSPAEHAWFCQLRPGNRGWVPITPALALADCDAWPPTRILGSSERFQSCQQCHGSQIEVAFDSASKHYDTRFSTLAINCESCHGPGRRHVELARSGTLPTAQDIGMRSLAALTKDQSLEVCFQCHAVKAALEPGYLPGKERDRHFALKLPILLDTIYFADGRTRVFAYQEGHLSSDCYLNGSMTCVDCHDPHSQHYRDINGVALPGRFDDGQCVDCHASKTQPIGRHTHHGATSAGSRCVSCHMPYLQEPSVGPRIRYARSDHTIPIPRPSYDARIGIENACVGCHRDRTVQELDDQVAKWYGALKPQAAMVAAVLAADAASDPTVAARTVLSAGGSHPMAQVAGLGLVLKQYTKPDVAALDAETTKRLEQWSQDSDLDVSALALASLHQLRGTDPQIRRFLAGALRRLGPRDGLVRSRWAWILRVRGEALLTAGDPRSALVTYNKALEVTPDDPAVWRSLGVVYTRLHDYPSAIERFQHSLSLRPRQPQVLVELGFALSQQGQADSAITAYRQAIDLDPWDPAAYANLGVAALRRGAIRPAIEALQRAVQLNPGLAEAQFALASAYGQLGDTKRALDALQRGLEFDPNNAAARRLLEANRR